MKTGVFSSHFLRLGLLCVGLVLSVQWVARGWAISQWSLQELYSRMGVSVPPGEVPDGHRRTALWQAQDALAAGAAKSAQALLEPAIVQGDTLAISAYGHALAAEGQRVRAVQAWERVGDFNSLRTAAQDWATEGWVAEAEQAFQAAYRIKPASITNQYVDFLKKTQGPEAAEAFVREVLERYPRHEFVPQWIYRLGDNLRLQGRLQEAEDVFLKGLEESPGTYYLLTGLGWVYYNMGKREEAVGLFEEATRADQGQGYGYFAIGQLLVQEGRYEEADNWFEQAVALEPASRNWCVARGHSARDGGLYPLAIRVYHECVERFPRDAEARFSLGWTYYLSQQYENAKNTLEEALALAPEPGASDWLRAGIIYESVGDAQRALNAYQKVISLDPGNSTAQAGVERLSAP